MDATEDAGIPVEGGTFGCLSFRGVVVISLVMSVPEVLVSFGVELPYRDLIP